VALDYAGFIETVASAAHISRDVAERAARATLRTLGERITRGEADDIAAQLPPEAAPYLESTARGAEAFDVDEFVRRVAERAAVGIPDAERLASAVFLRTRAGVVARRDGRPRSSAAARHPALAACR
jgi:uncharacterized protein (DUF2267 family)